MSHIYVDELVPWPGPPAPKSERYFGYGKLSCHLWCDRGEEKALHKLANSIGLRRDWYQEDGRTNGGLNHYDLTPTKRALALQAGAVCTDLSKWMIKNKPYEWDLP